MLALYDTAREGVFPIAPRDPGKIGLYVCGPTVYGAPHVGHGRSTLVYDILRRYLEHRRLDVVHVSNITDIDDKIIARAESERREWGDVAQECEVEWWQAMDLLGVKHPTRVPRATEYVTEMVELIAELVSRRVAYETSDGVYLDAGSVPDYGLLSHQRPEERLAGARVEMLEEKRSPIDFALWKKAKPNEPTWPSPFGPGRPGWHTECVVMSLALLGDGFDLHGGGQDLIFPHHENERAQAVALGRRFASQWVHNGLVVVGGEKMSKSLGNFTTLMELLDQYGGAAYRLLVLRAHYRAPLEVNQETLGDASAALARIESLARRFAEAPVGPRTVEAAAVEEAFFAAMDNDLESPTAVAGLFEALRKANALADRGDFTGAAPLASVVLESFGALGVLPGTKTGDDLDEATAELVRARDAARAGANYALADEIRSRLESLGWRVEDTASGTRVTPLKNRHGDV